MDVALADFPAVVKEIRNTLGLSQEDLARQIGVSFATVNRWEKQQAKPSRLAINQIESFCAREVEHQRLPSELVAALIRSIKLGKITRE